MCQELISTLEKFEKIQDTLLARLNPEEASQDVDMINPPERACQDVEMTDSVDSGYHRLPRGMIYVNFSDMFETQVNMNRGSEISGADEKCILDELQGCASFKKLLQLSAYQKKVTAILFEDGKGEHPGNYVEKYVARLKTLFPEKKILFHKHTNSAGKVSSMNFEKGLDGVWSGFIPQAARDGHEDWLQFVIELIMNYGNRHAFDELNIHQGGIVQRLMYMLNFNTGDLTQFDEPLLKHTFFSLAKMGAQTKADLCVKFLDHQKLALLDKLISEIEFLEQKHPNRPLEKTSKKRGALDDATPKRGTAPLVSNVATTRQRLLNLGLLKKDNITINEDMKKDPLYMSKTKNYDEIQARKVHIAMHGIQVAGLRVDCDDENMIRFLHGVATKNVEDMWVKNWPGELQDVRT